MSLAETVALAEDHPAGLRPMTLDSLRRDSDAADEADFWHRQGLIAEARRADRESLDGSTE